MKRFLVLIVLSLGFSALYAQGNRLPDIQIKDALSGETIMLSQVAKPGNITLISFWTTWCQVCKKEIISIRKQIAQERKGSPFRFVAISVDERKAEGLVRSYVQTQGWDFPCYVGSETEMKKALGFQNVPFNILVDKKGKLVWTYSGYDQQFEKELSKKIKELDL